MTKHDHLLIKELYIVSVPQLKRVGSILPVLLSETDSLVMYHHSVGTHLGHENYLYTNLCKSAKNQKSRISTVLGISHYLFLTVDQIIFKKIFI